MNDKLRFKCAKLVRDNIPQIMLEKYNSITSDRIMGDEEYELALKKKLIEEAQEVVDAETKIEMKEELADVLEVIQALAKMHGLSLEEIENTRSLKAEKNGGFTKRVYLEYIEMSSDNPKAEYYLANSDKYPMMK